MSKRRVNVPLIRPTDKSTDFFASDNKDAWKRKSKGKSKPVQRKRRG